MESGNSRSKKLTTLYIVLSAFFIGNALLAEVIGVKIFSLEKVLGLPPMHLSFLGGTQLDFNMSIGILLWPFVFILSDIINEYFGKAGVQRISIIGAILIGYSSVIILMGITLPPADFWQNLNNHDAAGRFMDINYAFKTLFRQGIGIIIGSIIAFLVSQLVDVYAFHYLRKFTGHKQLWLRSTGSTVISQLIDSFLILTIAFYWLGNWSFIQVISVGVVQYAYKISFAIILTPLIYVFHFVIDRYLGKEESYQIIEESDKNW